MADSLLLVGSEDPTLKKFLSKLGYQLLERSDDTTLPASLVSQMIDLLVLDSRGGIDCHAMLDLLRADEHTRGIPVVCLSDRPMLRYELKERSDERLEIIEVPYKIGQLVGRIATRLRLQKMAGAQTETASLAQVNIMLREHTERFQRELEEARSIQLSLLPEKLPTDDRYEVAVLYEPLEEVGGDWYYAQRNPSGAVGLEVADVTGHGLSAAFVGSMTKLAFTAANRDHPGELLTEMNRLMSGNIPAGKFVTMCALRYDPATFELSCARAGNPPALVCRAATQTVEELTPAGFAVGFFEDSEYPEQKVTLEANDLVAIFSDGITEAQNRDGEMYGHARLGASLCEAYASLGPQTSASQILAHAIERFEDFCDGRIVKDDITLIMIQRKK